jgi:hypothetical protein
MTLENLSVSYLICLKRTPVSSLALSFSLSFPLKEQPKKFNLDSDNTLVTSKAVKQREKQVIRR